MEASKAMGTNIAKCVVELIGGTPLLEVGRFAKERGLQGAVLAKLE